MKKYILWSSYLQSSAVAKLILFIFQGTYQLDESSEAKRPENARQVQQTISLHHAIQY